MRRGKPASWGIQKQWKRSIFHTTLSKILESIKIERTGLFLPGIYSMICPKFVLGVENDILEGALLLTRLQKILSAGEMAQGSH